MNRKQNGNRMRVWECIGEWYCGCGTIGQTRVNIAVSEWEGCANVRS